MGKLSDAEAPAPSQGGLVKFQIKSQLALIQGIVGGNGTKRLKHRLSKAQDALPAASASGSGKAVDKQPAGSLTQSPQRAKWIPKKQSVWQVPHRKANPPAAADGSAIGQKLPSATQETLRSSKTLPKPDSSHKTLPTPTGNQKTTSIDRRVVCIASPVQTPEDAGVTAGFKDENPEKGQPGGPMGRHPAITWIKLAGAEGSTAAGSTRQYDLRVTVSHRDHTPAALQRHLPRHEGPPEPDPAPQGGQTSDRHRHVDQHGRRRSPERAQRGAAAEPSGRRSPLRDRAEPWDSPLPTPASHANHEANGGQSPLAIRQSRQKLPRGDNGRSIRRHAEIRYRPETDSLAKGPADNGPCSRADDRQISHGMASPGGRDGLRGAHHRELPARQPASHVQVLLPPVPSPGGVERSESRDLSIRRQSIAPGYDLSHRSRCEGDQRRHGGHCSNGHPGGTGHAGRPQGRRFSSDRRSPGRSASPGGGRDRSRRSNPGRSRSPVRDSGAGKGSSRARQSPGRGRPGSPAPQRQPGRAADRQAGDDRAAQRRLRDKQPQGPRAHSPHDRSRPHRYREDEEYSASVTGGQRSLLKGRGHEAAQSHAPGRGGRDCRAQQPHRRTERMSDSAATVRAGQTSGRLSPSSREEGPPHVKKPRQGHDGWHLQEGHGRRQDAAHERGSQARRHCTGGPDQTYPETTGSPGSGQVDNPSNPEMDAAAQQAAQNTKLHRGHPEGLPDAGVGYSPRGSGHGGGEPVNGGLMPRLSLPSGHGGREQSGGGSTPRRQSLSAPGPSCPLPDCGDGNTEPAADSAPGLPESAAQISSPHQRQQLVQRHLADGDDRGVYPSPSPRCPPSPGLDATVEEHPSRSVEGSHPGTTVATCSHHKVSNEMHPGESNSQRQPQQPAPPLPAGGPIPHDPLSPPSRTASACGPVSLKTQPGDHRPQQQQQQPLPLPAGCAVPQVSQSLPRPPAERPAAAACCSVSSEMQPEDHRPQEQPLQLPAGFVVPQLPPRPPSQAVNVRCSMSSEIQPAEHRPQQQLPVVSAGCTGPELPQSPPSQAAAARGSVSPEIHPEENSSQRQPQQPAPPLPAGCAVPHDPPSPPSRTASACGPLSLKTQPGDHRPQQQQQQQQPLPLPAGCGVPQASQSLPRPPAGRPPAAARGSEMQPEDHRPHEQPLQLPAGCVVPELPPSPPSQAPNVRCAIMSSKMQPGDHWPQQQPLQQPQLHLRQQPEQQLLEVFAGCTVPELQQSPPSQAAAARGSISSEIHPEENSSQLQQQQPAPMLPAGCADPQLLWSPPGSLGEGRAGAARGSMTSEMQPGGHRPQEQPLQLPAGFVVPQLPPRPPSQPATMHSSMSSEIQPEEHRPQRQPQQQLPVALAGCTDPELPQSTPSHSAEAWGSLVSKLQPAEQRSEEPPPLYVSCADLQQPPSPPGFSAGACGSRQYSPDPPGLSHQLRHQIHLEDAEPSYEIIQKLHTGKTVADSGVALPHTVSPARASQPDAQPDSRHTPDVSTCATPATLSSSTPLHSHSKSSNRAPASSEQASEGENSSRPPAPYSPSGIDSWALPKIRFEALPELLGCPAGVSAVSPAPSSEMPNAEAGASLLFGPGQTSAEPPKQTAAGSPGRSDDLCALQGAEVAHSQAGVAKAPVDLPAFLADRSLFDSIQQVVTHQRAEPAPGMSRPGPLVGAAPPNDPLLPDERTVEACQAREAMLRERLTAQQAELHSKMHEQALEEKKVLQMALELDSFCTGHPELAVAKVMLAPRGSVADGPYSWLMIARMLCCQQVTPEYDTWERPPQYTGKVSIGTIVQGRSASTSVPARLLQLSLKLHEQEEQKAHVDNVLILSGLQASVTSASLKHTVATLASLKHEGRQWELLDSPGPGQQRSCTAVEISDRMRFSGASCLGPSSRRSSLRVSGIGIDEMSETEILAEWERLCAEEIGHCRFVAHSKAELNEAANKPAAQRCSQLRSAPLVRCWPCWQVHHPGQKDPLHFQQLRKLKGLPEDCQVQLCVVPSVTVSLRRLVATADEKTIQKCLVKVRGELVDISVKMMMRRWVETVFKEVLSGKGSQHLKPQPNMASKPATSHVHSGPKGRHETQRPPVAARAGGDSTWAPIGPERDPAWRPDNPRQEALPRGQDHQAISQPKALLSKHPSRSHLPHSGSRPHQHEMHQEEAVAVPDDPNRIRRRAPIPALTNLRVGSLAGAAGREGEWTITDSRPKAFSFKGHSDTIKRRRPVVSTPSSQHLLNVHQHKLQLERNSRAKTGRRLDGIPKQNKHQHTSLRQGSQGAAETLTRKKHSVRIPSVAPPSTPEAAKQRGQIRPPFKTQKSKERKTRPPEALAKREGPMSPDANTSEDTTDSEAELTKETSNAGVRKAFKDAQREQRIKPQVLLVKGEAQGRKRPTLDETGCREEEEQIRGAKRQRQKQNNWSTTAARASESPGDLHQQPSNRVMVIGTHRIPVPARRLCPTPGAARAHGATVQLAKKRTLSPSRAASDPDSDEAGGSVGRRSRGRSKSRHTSRPLSTAHKSRGSGEEAGGGSGSDSDAGNSPEHRRWDGEIPPDPLRCKRSDGVRWRCVHPRLPGGFNFCAKHAQQYLHRGLAVPKERRKNKQRLSELAAYAAARRDRKKRQAARDPSLSRASSGLSLKETALARLRQRQASEQERVRLKWGCGRAMPHDQVAPMKFRAAEIQKELQQLGGEPKVAEKTRAELAAKPISRVRMDATDGSRTAIGSANPFQRKKLRLGRSGVHDWGLFATEVIQKNDFVIEYVGERVRMEVANLREQHYLRTGKDNYLFRVDDEWVVDATVTGGLARFINHSCGPNCVTKIVTSSSGTNHIVIFALRSIEPGEELTYDYMFEFEEDSPDRVPCHCGSEECRGWLN